ncbi:thiamine diphosphokinase [Actibacterium ureilyticum]|uniref:thiamine diphosphokinase n=1 Tax=Actibacterium ureilyticum TaxID=1590614 RepID=UPI000BAA9E8D|nr:thiamine diphosphokinase [Actibacterium ureilyticum]
MTEYVVHSPDMVTILGAAETSASDLEQALTMAPTLIAADGGADFALKHGHMPDLVIGDFDSLSQNARQQLGAQRLLAIAEQDSTDFDKCLSRVRAKLVLGLGFLGTRLDHTLSVLNGLTRCPGQPCLLIGPHDVAFLCPPELQITLPVGSRLSLFPLGPVRGRSSGLHWPVDGIDFAPDGRIGTSNRVADTDVTLNFDAPRMVVLLPRAAKLAAVSALIGEDDALAE